MLDCTSLHIVALLTFRREQLVATSQRNVQGHHGCEIGKFLHRAAGVLEVVGLGLAVAASLEPAGDAHGNVAAVSRHLRASRGALFGSRAPFPV